MLHNSVNGAPIDSNKLWETRPELTHIRDCAEKRNVSAWGTLGAVICRTIAATEPLLQLPPMIGGRASLNMFVALTGKSGDGKGSAVAVAEEAFNFVDVSMFEVTIKTLDTGTGEGIAAAFNPPKAKGDEEPEPPVTRAMVEESEVTNLGALNGRAGSTLASSLLKFAMGERVGFTNAVAKREPLLKHAYRLTMTVQVQPEHAGEIMEHRGAGLPQRFLFLPTRVETAGCDFKQQAQGVYEELKACVVTIPKFDKCTLIQVPQEICELVIREHYERARRDMTEDDSDDVSGHRNLMRLKVAAALAILNGRADNISTEDWELAGLIFAKHDETLAKLQLIADRERTEKNKRKAQRDAELSDLKEVEHERRYLDRVAAERKRIIQEVERADNDGVNKSNLRKGLKAGYIRDAFDEALDALIEEGTVEVGEFVDGSAMVMIRPGKNWSHLYAAGELE